MNQTTNPSEPQTGQGSDGQKTRYTHPIRFVPSGIYYARFRGRGKLIWQSLKADKIKTAKLRLNDLEKARREAAAEEADVERGRMTFGGY